MSWKDQRQPASFRGVTFAVDNGEMVFGRRNQLHEYPQKDVPYSEDLGRVAREYTFNAFIIGENYFSARDALIAAIEENDSPGTLVHPTLGTKIVTPKPCRVIYSNQEGGIERFVLTFIEAGENSFPDNLNDLQELVGLYATEAIEGIFNNFKSSFNVSGFQSFVLNAATDISRNFISEISAALITGTPESESFSELMENINDFSLTQDTDVLIPETFGENIHSIITELTSVYTEPKEAYEAQKKLTTFGSNFITVSETTPSRIQQSRNQEALINLVRNCSVIEMVRITSELDYASRPDAIAIRDEVDEILEERLLTLANTGNDDQYNVITKARAAMIKDINIRGAKLSDLSTLKTDDEISALVFAYNQYEDASRDSEIIERNHIQNPLFIPSDTPIEILT